MKLSPSAMQLLRAIVILMCVSPVARGQSPDSFGSGGSISGRVLFAGDHRPAENVKVELRLSAGAWVATAMTGVGGEFSFGGLPFGNYWVIVQEPGCDPIQESVQVGSGPGLLLLELNRTPAARPPSVGYVVSARELAIPSKARKAFQSGLQRLAKNDFSGSVTRFQSAITQFPNYYEAYYQMAVADLKLGRDADGEQALRKSIELSGGQYANAQFTLGAFLSYQGKFAEAEPTIRKGLALDNTAWRGHYWLARTLFGLNRLVEAEKSAREVVARKADFAKVYLLLADIHIRRNDAPGLLKDLDDYLKLDPSSPTGIQAKALRENVQRTLSQASSAKP